MRKFLTLAFLLFSLGLMAQPINDDCGGLIDLGVAPACPDSVFFTNVDATASDIGFSNIPNCFNGGTVQNDVWFAFTTSDTIFDYTITVTGITDGMGSDPLMNPQIALYRGDCQVDGLAEIACETVENGEFVVELDVLGLTPNVVYFIRINDYSATATPNWGSFQLCVEEISPINTIDEGSSIACTGQLFDSGGPDGDYENNEDNTFTICPADPAGCITFTLEYYNIQSSPFILTDQIIFYDGDEANPGNIIGSLGGNDFGVGNDEGGGAVCYQVQASSGCLTVQFISDGDVTFEGFAGAWECSALPCDPIDPITVDPNITNEQIEDFIATPQTSVTVTNVDCPNGAYGLFETTDNSDLGLERGLLLTSGDLDWAVGPNNDPGGGNFNANNGAPGDADLDYLSQQFGDGSQSNDACIVELEVVPATNELTFEYIFGSDEYPEFVDQFNDIFAFLISGPGITGDPNIGNQQNIAVLPDGNNTLVQINSVNNLINWEYYRNNENGQSVEYDGLTSDFLGVKKSLTARAEVIPCSTYQLKLAVADRLDFVYDSGVFISELSGGTPNLGITFNSGIDYLIEDCTNQADEVVISLNQPQDEAITYNVTIGGTATLGVDYDLQLPPSITFQPGETEFVFPLTPLSDLEVEDIETIEISLSNDFGCGTVTFNALTIELHDELNIEIFTGQDTAFVCQDSSLVLEVDGAVNYFWTPIDVIDNPISSTPTATPTESQWVYVEGTVGPCVDNDSIYLQIIDPEIFVQANDPTDICIGDAVQLETTNNVNNQNLIWTPAEGLDDPTSPTPIATPVVNTDYVATVEVAGCIVSDTVSIDVDKFDFPIVTGDTLICENYSVQLASLIDTDTTNTIYAWTPNTDLDNDSTTAAIATPAQTTTYTLTATSENGACSQTEQMTIEVFPADVEIQGADTLEICLGEVADLVAVTSTGSADNLLWSPYDGFISDSVGLNVTTSPEVSTTYYTMFEIGACTVFDSVFVKVDSLPASDILAEPEKDPYCIGELVTLISTTYEPSFFPGIEHMWLEGPGYETGDSLWNMVLTTQDTFTYQRVTTIGACVDTAEITLNVVVPTPFTIEPALSEICPGESVELFANYTGQDGELTWEPETGLSCLDCFDPVATPQQSTNYTLTIDVEGCPVSASAAIRVAEPPVLSVINDTPICEGDAIQLNLDADDNSTYTWSSPDDPDFTSSEPLLIVNPTETTTYVLNASNDCFADSSTVTISVISTPELTVSDDMTVCQEDPITLEATTVTSEGTVESFVWEYNGSTFEGATVDIEGVPGVSVATLTYTYGTGNEFCGTLTESVTLTVNPAPQLELPADLEVCAGESLVLNLMPDDGTDYVWTGPDLASTESAPTITPAATGEYSVTATTEGCPPKEETFTVVVVQDSDVTIDGIDAICTGDAVTLTAITDAADGVSEVFLWEWPESNTSNESSITVSDLTQTTTFDLTYVYGPNCGTVTTAFTVDVDQGVNITSIAIDPLEALVDSVHVGESAVLTAITSPEIPVGVSYSWNTGATTPEITIMPTETPSEAYTITVVNQFGCSDSMTINVPVAIPEFKIPNIFSPNGDDSNDEFRLLTEVEVDITEFKIYNRWGQVVYDNSSDPNPATNFWDGTYNGNLAPSEVYIYVVAFQLQGEVDGEVPDEYRFELRGDVTLLR